MGTVVTPTLVLIGRNQLQGRFQFTYISYRDQHWGPIVQGDTEGKVVGLGTLRGDFRGEKGFEPNTEALVPRAS